MGWVCRYDGIIRTANRILLGNISVKKPLGRIMES
jgi:hypothetical protein